MFKDLKILLKLIAILFAMSPIAGVADNTSCKFSNNHLTEDTEGLSSEDLQVLGCPSSIHLQQCINEVRSKVCETLIENSNKNISQHLIFDSKNFFKIVLTVADKVRDACLHDLPEFLEESNSSVILKCIVFNDMENELQTKYAQISVNDVLSNINTPIGIAIWPKKDKMVSTKELPPLVIQNNNQNLNGTYWWNEACAPHNITFNVDNDAAINSKGMQELLYGKDSDDEVFIDFPKGKFVRAFPGLLMNEKGHFSSEISVIAYYNPYTAYEKAKSIAQTLKGTACANLDVYIVGLAITKNDTDTKIQTSDPNEHYSGSAWNLLTQVGAGATAIGATAKAYTKAVPILKKSVIMKKLAKMAAPKAVHGAISSVAPYLFEGAVAIGALTALAAAFYPFSIENEIEQVAILAEPIPIN